MQFSAYSDYKNSGVDWLGEVPKHWQVIPSKFYFLERGEKAEADDRQLTASQKYGIVYQDDYMADKGRVMTVIKNPEILKKVKPLDFVISMRSFQGGLELSYKEGSISSAYVMLKPNLNYIDTEFFKYLFKTTRYIQALQSTSNLIRDGQALRFNNFSQIKLILPPIKEQNQIADFLDNETAKIDNLIAKQEQLIVLLEEQRKSVISHAVTKGLDPNAPMKDNGVEWLGEVPSHWQDYSYQHLFKKKEIINQTQEQLLSVYLDRGVIPYAEGGGLVHKPADSLEKYQLVDIDDFVMNNQQAWRGSVGISAYRGIVSPAYLIFSINKDLASSKFLKYLLKDKSIVEQFMLASMSVGTIQRQIKWHLLKNLHINLPPINEQNQIAQFLDKETAKIDGLIQKQQELITQLKEYRTSVISHAVTGKIDVRKLV